MVFFSTLKGFLGSEPKTGWTAQQAAVGVTAFGDLLAAEGKAAARLW